MGGVLVLVMIMLVFFFKQKTAYEMRISDGSSDVCSSDLRQEQDGNDRQRLNRSHKDRNGTCREGRKAVGKAIPVRVSRPRRVANAAHLVRPGHETAGYHPIAMVGSGVALAWRQ